MPNTEIGCADIRQRLMPTQLKSQIKLKEYVNDRENEVRLKAKKGSYMYKLGD